MKLITAIIRPDKLDRVRQALLKAEITRITVSRCSGRGQAERMDLYRGLEVAPELVPKIRLDIACNDEFKQITVFEPANQAAKPIKSSNQSGTITSFIQARRFP